ncbi:CRE-FZR-1 protein [Caenorhabditis remanei]|uniref:Fizzy-related protein homolog n=1 Tax=Caenorhabditis remanei TaxID=31234 RepID=E3NB14_CAERE|nr:CRE-FZR-1 protein [Caenorhabditis remanei]
MDEQVPPPNTTFPVPFQSPMPVRRTLGPHNSPVKSMSTNSSAHTSPRVTPTKGANPYGDRFMPLRQSNFDWNARFNSINAEEEGNFKKPMGSSCTRHINGIPNTSILSSSASSSHASTSSLSALGSGSSSSVSSITTAIQQHIHTTATSPAYQEYYQGVQSSSGNTSPTAMSSCLDDSRNGEAVLRALLRNEMLKDRIDDVKSQIQTSEETIASFSLAPVVSAYPNPVPEGSTPRGHIPQLERNAYGGSVDSVFPVMSSEGVNDVTRISSSSHNHPNPNTSNNPNHTNNAHGHHSNVHGAHSPTMAQMMEPRLRAGGDSAIEIPLSPAASICAAAPGTAETPTKSLSLPLSPVAPKQSPARALFAYSAKTTPVKYGVTAPVQTTSPFGGPFGVDSQRLLRTPRKPIRKVPKNPYKVLDAPELQDDFYLNLVDWSSQNQLSVGLSACVYLWSATTSQVIKLCDLSVTNEQDQVTSVQWCDKGDLLAVGTNRGITQIWDVTTQKKVRDLAGHTSRIGCLAWNADTICSGSRDRTIIHRDIRCDDHDTGRKLTNHRQEVCGLKWSPDKQLLASGGNDNQLLVWNLRRPEPIQTYNQHNAAVKALAWSPHHHGLLVSGGGTADRCLRFWNTLTAQPMQCVDTGSQVCNVAWSKHSSELVSTHGYSYNHVIIWKYPSLQPVTKLVGHQYRVLYLAMSPDGESIVTGAGDETLRFWHVFNKGNPPTITRSKLNLHSTIR